MFDWFKKKKKRKLEDGEKISLGEAFLYRDLLRYDNVGFWYCNNRVLDIEKQNSWMYRMSFENGTYTCSRENEVLFCSTGFPKKSLCTHLPPLEPLTTVDTNKR